MIDSANHVEINGVKYRLASVDDRYVASAQPLRPVNTVPVQGDPGVFQMRSDVLQWSWTDWSGGEGLNIFDAQQPTRSYELTGVDAFSIPGTLRPGYYVEDTQDSSGAADLAVSGILVRAMDKLWLLDADSNKAYEWDDTNTRWKAAITNASAANGAGNQAAGDRDAFYYIENGTNNVWSYDGSSWTKISDTLIATVGRGTYLHALGPYVYVFHPAGAQVWEIAKDGSAEVSIDSWTDYGNGPYAQNPVTVLDGRVYVMCSYKGQTQIRRITPTSAAGTGYGEEIARINGFEGQGIWSHAANLFLIGTHDGASRRQRAVLYLAPGGSYGAIGHIRPEDNLGRPAVNDAGGQMLEHFFVTQQRSSSETDPAVWQVDSVTGAYACLSVAENTNASGLGFLTLASHKGDIFTSTVTAAATKRTLRARQDGYMENSQAISPWNNFGLVDSKILGTLRLSCEALPANWKIYVDYATDGASSFTTAITYTTTGGTGTSATVTTDSSTVSFDTLRLRVRMEETGAGMPTSAPVILGIEARVQVAKLQKVWDLVLDLRDDRSGRGGMARRGQAKISNIKTAGDLGTAIRFKNGAEDREPGQFDDLDVVLDAYQITLPVAGEGTARVRLLEVV